MNSKIIIQDKQTKETLYTFPHDQSDHAFERALSLEKMGLEIEIHSPNSIETLGSSLGHDSEKIKNINAEINLELENH